MKIAINASILDDKMDGVRIFTLNIIKAILSLPEAEKHEFTIFTPCPKYFKQHKNIRIVKIPSLMLNSKHQKIAPLFRFFWNNFIYTFLAKDFDISYSTTPNGSLFLKNQIITIHDIIAFHYPKIYKMRSYYFRFVLPLMLKNSSSIFTVSNFLKKEINNTYNYPLAKIKVSPCAYNKDIFKINKKIKRKKSILIVGATYEYKNIERALSAYMLLPKEIKNDYKIFIVGGNKAYLEKIKKIADYNNLKDNIKIFNYLQQEKLAKMYRSAELLVYPSLYEGFGLPPLEAMASGCPVAVSNIPTTKGVCGNAAYYFDPRNTEDIKKAMTKLLTNKTLRKNLIKQGLKRAKLFSWKNSARKVLNALEHST